ncbi:MAG TPA: hypothetical protein VEA59_03855 [Patescibacteria group bacterium]|nr:hypothetical protein [Patescibacteria group bacterium]
MCIIRLESAIREGLTHVYVVDSHVPEGKVGSISITAKVYRQPTADARKRFAVVKVGKTYNPKYCLTRTVLNETKIIRVKEDQ